MCSSVVVTPCIEGAELLVCCDSSRDAPRVLRPPYHTATHSDIIPALRLVFETTAKQHITAPGASCVHQRCEEQFTLYQMRNAVPDAYLCCVVGCLKQPQQLYHRHKMRGILEVPLLISTVKLGSIHGPSRFGLVTIVVVSVDALLQWRPVLLP